MAALHAQYIHEELQDLGLDDYLSDGEEDSEDQVLYENDQRRTLLAFLQQDQPSVPSWKKPASQLPPDSGKGSAARLSSQNKNVSPGWRSSSQILSSRHEDSCQDAGSSFALDNFAASFDNPAEWEDGPPLVAAPPHSETAALDALFHFSATLADDKVPDQPAAASQLPTQQTKPNQTNQTQSAEQEHQLPTSQQHLRPPADSNLPSSPSPPSPSLSTHHTSADGRSQSEDKHSFSQKIMTPISDRPSVLHQMLSLSQKLPPSSEPIQTDTTVGSPGSSYHPHSHYTAQTPASLEDEEDIAAKTDTRPEEEGEEEEEGSDLRFTDANTTDSPKHNPIPSQPTLHPPAKKQRRPPVWKESHSKRGEKTTSTSLKSADKDTSEVMTPTWAGVPSSSFLRFPSVQLSQPGRGGRSKARLPKPKLTFSVKRAAIQRNEFDTPEEDPSQAVQEGAGFRMAQMLQKLTGGPPPLNARQQQQPSMSQRAKQVGKRKEGGRHPKWSESQRDGEQIADEEDGGWEEEEQKGAGRGGEQNIFPSPTEHGHGSQRMMEQFRNGLPAATFGLPFRLPLSQRGSLNLATALQRVLDQEKHSRIQFLRAYNSGRPLSGAADTLDVRIQASSLEGHITKCACRVVQQPKSWSTDGGGSFATAGSRGNTTRPDVVQVWFAARLYSDVDFENGAMVRVCAPWHEIHTDRHSFIILCTSFATQLEDG